MKRTAALLTTLAGSLALSACGFNLQTIVRVHN